MPLVVASHNGQLRGNSILLTDLNIDLITTLGVFWAIYFGAKEVTDCRPTISTSLVQDTGSNLIVLRLGIAIEQ